MAILRTGEDRSVRRLRRGEGRGSERLRRGGGGKMMRIFL
jgi:hypothetical protein